jgi:hypothetical protein
MGFFLEDSVHVLAAVNVFLAVPADDDGFARVAIDFFGVFGAAVGAFVLEAIGVIDDGAPFFGCYAQEFADIFGGVLIAAEGFFLLGGFVCDDEADAGVYFEGAFGCFYVKFIVAVGIIGRSFGSGFAVGYLHDISSLWLFDYLPF